VIVVLALASYGMADPAFPAGGPASAGMNTQLVQQIIHIPVIIHLVRMLRSNGLKTRLQQAGKGRAMMDLPAYTYVVGFNDGRFDCADGRTRDQNPYIKEYKVSDETRPQLIEDWYAGWDYENLNALRD